MGSAVLEAVGSQVTSAGVVAAPEHISTWVSGEVCVNSRVGVRGLHPYLLPGSQRAGSGVDGDIGRHRNRPFHRPVAGGNGEGVRVAVHAARVVGRRSPAKTT